MTMNWSLNRTKYGETNQTANQTIFLATRMDLMAHIIPKREKPKQPVMATKKPYSFAEFQQKPTIH
jgi:hypothetical protein